MSVKGLNIVLTACECKKRHHSWQKSLCFGGGVSLIKNSALKLM